MPATLLDRVSALDLPADLKPTVLAGLRLAEATDRLEAKVGSIITLYEEYEAALANYRATQSASQQEGGR